MAAKHFTSYLFFTTSSPILQAVSVTAGIRPTTPVSGHKPNVPLYFHNRLVGTSVRSLAGRLAKSQCHPPPKKSPKTNSIGRSLQMIRWWQTLWRSFSAGWRLLTRWPLIRSIIRLWWRLGMWGMSVRFSHLPDYPAPALDSLMLVLSPSMLLFLTPSHFELVCWHFWMETSWLIDAISSQLALRRRRIKEIHTHWQWGELSCIPKPRVMHPVRCLTPLLTSRMFPI